MGKPAIAGHNHVPFHDENDTSCPWSIYPPATPDKHPSRPLMYHPFATVQHERDVIYIRSDAGQLTRRLAGLSRKEYRLIDGPALLILAVGKSETEVSDLSLCAYIAKK